VLDLAHALLEASISAVVLGEAPNGPGFTRRHPPNCRWSTVTLNSGMIGGRVQAVLGAPCGASALPANLNPNLQNAR
jgi:hypothetical protein